VKSVDSEGVVFYLHTLSLYLLYPIWFFVSPGVIAIHEFLHMPVCYFIFILQTW